VQTFSSPCSFALATCCAGPKGGTAVGYNMPRCLPKITPVCLAPDVSSPSKSGVYIYTYICVITYNYIYIYIHIKIWSNIAYHTQLTEVV
jgi:hypothetical protein